MVTVHIPKSESASGPKGPLARACADTDVVIDSDPSVPICIKPEQPIGRLISEALKIARESGSTVTLDGMFEKDLEAVIASHREPLSTDWNECL